MEEDGSYATDSYNDYQINRCWGIDPEQAEEVVDDFHMDDFKEHVDK